MKAFNFRVVSRSVALLILIVGVGTSYLYAQDVQGYTLVQDMGYEYPIDLSQNYFPGCTTSSLPGQLLPNPCRTPNDIANLPYSFELNSLKNIYNYRFRAKESGTKVFRISVNCSRELANIWSVTPVNRFPESITFSNDPRYSTDAAALINVWLIDEKNPSHASLVYGVLATHATLGISVIDPADPYSMFSYTPDINAFGWKETTPNVLNYSDGKLDSYIIKDTRDFRRNLLNTTMNEWRAPTWGTPIPNTLTLVIQVYSYQAYNIKFNIPYLGSFDVDALNNQLPKFNVHVNDKPANNSAQTPIAINLGDKVRFEVKSPTPLDKPKISNLAATWIARSAGETKYFCTPSITPGEFKPWLGFDSQVHGSFIAKYPPGYQPREKDWEHSVDANGLHTYALTWYAQRQMEATKETYQPYMVWPLTKTVSNAVNYEGGSTTTQRNSQRDGLNMELLRAYKLGSRYVLGTDPDEYVYLDQQDISPLQHKVLKGQYEGWKIPQHTGPGSDNESDDPIIDLVKAYKNFQEAKNGLDINRNYFGYEIEDYGTYCAKRLDPTKKIKVADPTTPCGEATKFDCLYNSKGWSGQTDAGKNNTAPGKITLEAGFLNQKIALNVSSPLSLQSFYGVIEGTQWPARYESNVPYSLLGLEGKSREELERYILCLQHVNSIGHWQVQSRRLKDILTENPSLEQAIRQSGRWTEKFDITDGGYYDVTAFIRTTDGADSVIIGGKELRVIDLRFNSVAGSVNQGNYAPGNTPAGIDLQEGRGDGKYWYLIGYNLTSPFHIPIYGYADNKYQKHYTFSRGDVTTFCTFDADPHTFENYATEYYISKRLQAKGVPDDTLASGKYITWWRSPIVGSGFQGRELVTTGAPVKLGNGRNLSINWSDLGSYELKVKYRTDTMKILYAVDVVPYQYNSGDKTSKKNDVKGEIKIYELTPDQKRWLGLPANTPYQVATVENILSRYKYVDGPRHPGDAAGVNRYEKFNHFNGEYQWKIDDDFYSHENFVESWLQQEKNHINQQWFPRYWMRHTSNNNTPPAEIPADKISVDINDFDSQLQAVFQTSPEPWQIRLPWIAPTPFSGYLTRTNVKVVYDIEKFFDEENGAFCGKGNPNFSNYDDFRKAVSNPIDPAKFTDEEKEKYAFYISLLHQSKIIFDTTNVSSLEVKNGWDFQGPEGWDALSDPDNPTRKNKYDTAYLIARTELTKHAQSSPQFSAQFTDLKGVNYDVYELKNGNVISNGYRISNLRTNLNNPYLIGVFDESNLQSPGFVQLNLRALGDQVYVAKPIGQELASPNNRFTLTKDSYTQEHYFRLYNVSDYFDNDGKAKSSLDFTQMYLVCEGRPQLQKPQGSYKLLNRQDYTSDYVLSSRQEDPEQIQISEGTDVLEVEETFSEIDRESLIRYLSEHPQLILMLDGAIEQGLAFDIYSIALRYGFENRIAFKTPAGWTVEQVRNKLGNSFPQNIMITPVLYPEDWVASTHYSDDNTEVQRPWPWATYLAYKDAEKNGGWTIPAYELQYKNNSPSRASKQMDEIRNEINNAKWIGISVVTPTSCNAFRDYCPTTELSGDCANYDRRGDMDFCIAHGINYFITDDFTNLLYYLQAIPH